MSDARKIISLYKSRNTIIEVASSLDYNVDGYDRFSMNELDSMYKFDQLDMLLTHKKVDKKIYIKYHLPEKQKQISKSSFDNIIEDLYQIEKVLTMNDTLVIIMDEEPNDSNIQKMNYLYEHDGYFIVMHNIKRLQFNILKHTLVPRMIILDDNETERVMNTLHITDKSQFPEISRYDPQALALLLRPNQVCRIHRDSVTAMNCIYYRVCV